MEKRFGSRLSAGNVMVIPVKGMVKRLQDWKTTLASRSVRQI